MQFPGETLEWCCRKYCEHESVKFAGNMAFFMRFGPFFYDECKAGQDKMFILTLMLYCTSKNSFILNHAKFRLLNWRLNNNFSRQGEKVSRIGDRIGRNFEPRTSCAVPSNGPTDDCGMRATFRAIPFISFFTFLFLFLHLLFIT